VVGSSSNIYKAGWFSDWKAMGLIGVAIVCFIIALAAMFGQAFNMPEAKAFANTELKQAVISVLLIVSLIALVTFFNEVAWMSVTASDLPVSCNSVEPCYVTAAKAYLAQLSDTGNEYAKNELRESIVNAKRASYGYNLNLNKIYLLFAGMSIRFNAGDSLIAERHGALFTQVSKLMGSLSSQKYFVDVVTFGIAPLFILLGIVLRTFFFTRKLGGLLLAIAISLFIVYPLTYAFAWYTLNVTVYGERTLAVADPSCPGECTGTYPVAFFTNDKGELVQFSTTQAIMRTGINKSNWASGGPAGAFPGLVACRDLSSINIPQSVAPTSCGECPDYCRDVPFPSGIPGCNITKCSTCNPGCKIVRQRLNCQTDPACEGKCPLNCRTRTPLENKCINNESGGIVSANLAVNCSGCDKYPNWCKFLKNESGTISLVYDDPKMNAACNGIQNEPDCPSQCFYITSMGKDTTCDSICSDPATGTVCPKACRVDELLNSPSWVSTYDTDPPNMTKKCQETPQIAAACATCAKHPECLITAGAIDGCSPYPATTHSSQSCLDCPDYCRRANFDNYFNTLSNSERDAASNLPNACVPSSTNLINCSASGSPPACAATCRTSLLNTPTICRPLQTTPGANLSLCGACPDVARFKVRYTKSGSCGGQQEEEGGGNTNQGAPSGGYSVLLSPSQQALAAGRPDGTILLASGGGEPGQQPVMKSSRISPIPPRTNLQMHGYCNATTGTSGDLYFNYIWYKDNTVFFQGTTLEAAVPGLEYEVDTPVQPSSLAVGQVWILSCQATHGSQASAWLNSTSATVQGPQGEPPCTITVANLTLNSQYNCSSSGSPAACPSSCQGGIIDLPNESASPACNDVLITSCPYGCRVKGAPANYLNAAACSGCAALRSQHPECFVDPTAPTAPSTPWPVCSEYIGNGPKSCHSDCVSVFRNETACTAPGTGCTWDAGKNICDKASCTAIGNMASCATAGCKWMYTSSYVPINNRAAPYDDREKCRQCPEQCRLDGYTGSCGVIDNKADVYVDCSMAACPATCRIPEPIAPSQPECLPYPESTSSACQGCPALCRRQSDIMYSLGGCDTIPNCEVGGSPTSCTENCLLENPPVKACEGCLDCDYDCTYYPAIRTDCSDICSDEALAGPVNIEPNDFIKSLPGAKTAYVETKNIGVLYMPSVVLPLFCIVIVISFIRVLSPVLGGDIEIPGLGRII